MFKKTLIAAALATTALGAAASTVTTTKQTVGVEYAAGIKQVTISDIVVTPQRDYGAGDVIRVTVTGADLATMTNASTPAAITPTLTPAGNMVSNIQFLEYDGNSAIFLVTNPIAEGAGTSMTVGGLQVKVADANSKTKVKVSASGVVETVLGAKNVDSSTAVDSLDFAQQLSSKVKTKFSKTVDVNVARAKFTDGSTSDTLVLENTNATVNNAVTTTGAEYKVWGDFSFLDKNGNGSLGDSGDGAITSTGGTVTVANDMMYATIKSTAAVSSGTVGITVNAPSGVVIPDQSFYVDAHMMYNDPAGGSTDLKIETLAKTSAGAWSLNGAKAHIPFLPIKPEFAQGVLITNTSSQSGGVDMMVYHNGQTTSFENIGTVTAKGVTDLSKTIMNVLSTAGIKGDVAIDLVINAPGSAITVEALYYSKADADRLRTL